MNNNNTKNKYTIYLDFDGTVVEHAYPDMGRPNFGCIEIIEKLQKAGHTIILNTMRCEFGNGSLEEALNLINNEYWCISLPDNRYDINIDPISSTKQKLNPGYWDWEFFHMNKTIYIDDICIGIPLKKCKMINDNMVDWDAINDEFIREKIY